MEDQAGRSLEEALIGEQEPSEDVTEGADGGDFMGGEPTGSRQKGIQNSGERRVLGRRKNTCALTCRGGWAEKNTSCSSGSGAKRKFRPNGLNFLDEVRGKLAAEFERVKVELLRELKERETVGAVTEGS